MVARLSLLAALLAVAAAPTTASAAVEAHGSVGQAYVVGAKRHALVKLLGPRGGVLRTGRADRLGSRIFRDVRPGAGYRMRVGARTTKRFRVLRRDANPPAAFFLRKRLKQGLNYVKMRDGVELAMTVRLPAGKKLSDGPFPTVIEYSGYQVAAPNDLLQAIASGKDDPLAPASSTVVGSVIAPLLGFATVSVQMRGSGCSGGAFDLFDLPTTYDGYDAVEAVAAQSWVKAGRVGLVGISFSGITQLFAGGTRPPHLAAIAPLSVTDDTYDATGYPGGIFNKGFALSWIEERLADARPAPAGGQPYARILARRDKHCRANQRLRLQTQDALGLIRRNPFRTPKLFDQRAGAAWLSRIEVPVFLVGSFQDEQTGGHFARSLGELRRNPRVWITLQNGVHVDSLGPDTITRWVEFLKLYVADEVPRVPDSVLALGDQLYQVLAGAPASEVQQSRLAELPSADAARDAFERDPRVRLLMDNGAGPAGTGALGSAWELGYDAWPIREAQPTGFFLAPGGVLAPAAPAEASTAGYVADPGARPKQTLPGNGADDAWKAQPPYTWAPVAAGKGLAWATAPLDRDVVIAGASSFDVFLRSTARDTDLQVTLSEIRPDGNETYVQNGWLRASHRRLDARRSTSLDPVPTHLRRDAAPLSATAFSLVRVPIFPVAHAFRAGSRIRVSLTAPGGDRPRWDFASVDDGKARNTVGLGGAQASKLVLPLLAGATAQGTPLPAPTALRGEPNRGYAPASNGG